MTKKPTIKNISYYVPNNEIHNDYFVQHYENKYDKDVSGLLKATGRENRRVCDEHESILTMAVEATKDVLKKEGLTSKDIDMIVFSTGTPEYIQPCNAVKLHNLLGCKEDVMVYDLNASCVGMVVALTQAINTMKCNKNIKYAIVVGSEQLFSFSHESKVVPYSNFGESACTILLKNVDVDIKEKKGLLDFKFHTDSNYDECIHFPSKGMKNAILDDNITTIHKMVDWSHFELEASHGTATQSINNILKNNNIEKHKIKKYFLSQFTKSGIEMIAENLGEDMSKFKYIGDKYGYTGTTSPFLALANSFKEKEIKEGDYILFWSVGSGFTCHTSLFKL